MLVTLCAYVFQALVVLGAVFVPIIHAAIAMDELRSDKPLIGQKHMESLWADRAMKKFIVSPICILLLVLAKASAIALLGWYGQVGTPWISAMACVFIWVHVEVVIEVYFPVWFSKPCPDVDIMNQDMKDVWGVLSPAARLSIAVGKTNRELVSTALGVDLTDDSELYKAITAPEYEGMITV